MEFEPAISPVAEPNDDASRAALASVKAALWPDIAVDIRSISGGMTNRNFVMSAGGTSVMVHVQLPDHLAHIVGIDRERQLVANGVAAAAGIAPAVLLALNEPRVLVTEFVEGGTAIAGQLTNADSLLQVAELLRRLHSAPVDARLDSWVSHPFVGTHRLRELALEADSSLTVALDDCYSVVTRMEALHSDWDSALTHIDLSPANLVGGSDLRLVDWEYAGLGDPLFDVADFVVKNPIDDNQLARFLEAYKGAASDRDVAVVRLYGITSLLREALWAIAMTRLGFADFAHRDYAIDITRDLSATVAEPWVSAALDTLTLSADRKTHP